MTDSTRKHPEHNQHANMNLEFFERLYDIYKNAPEIYQATSYWREYEAPIIEDIRKFDINQIRSGKYHSFNTFGFNERVYTYPPGISKLKKLFLKLLHNHIIGDKHILPYSINIDDVREMAFRHCELYKFPPP